MEEKVGSVLEPLGTEVIFSIQKTLKEYRKCSEGPGDT